MFLVRVITLKMEWLSATIAGEMLTIIQLLSMATMTYTIGCTTTY